MIFKPGQKVRARIFFDGRHNPLFNYGKQKIWTIKQVTNHTHYYGKESHKDGEWYILSFDEAPGTSWSGWLEIIKVRIKSLPAWL